MGSQLDLLLLLTSAFTTNLISADRFMVVAPSVFHVGVKETVLVQVGKALLNKPVTCYLEQEVKRVLMSEKKTVQITQKGQFRELNLQVTTDKVTELQSTNGEPPYLNLVCDVGEKERQITRVLVSQHRGYIFIQTDQPIYNPTQLVQYRVFVLNHAMRPTSGNIHIHLINAEENTIKKMLLKVEDGIISKNFRIPDISLPGVWKIKAFLSGDEKNATVREFKVQKFVLPSFSVSIKPGSDYLLLQKNLKSTPEESFILSIDASYSYGKKISGGFHCRFGVRPDGSNDINFIKGLEKTGPVRDGEAEVSLKLSDVWLKVQSEIGEDLPVEGSHFYIAVTVTDRISGEIQETEMFLPIESQRYLVDLSRTRSHYIPQMPLDVVVVVRTASGLPAANVQLKIEMANTAENSVNRITDQEGTAVSPFNLNQSPSFATVEVTVDGIKSTKKILPATSPTNSFLYININNRVIPQEHSLGVVFSVVNGKPEDNHIYYMVVSKGAVVNSGSLEAKNVLTKTNILFSPNMIPSFRLIGYYYHSDGELVADSVWVDVEDACEGMLKVTEDDVSNSYIPGTFIPLKLDVGKQRARVALLTVDKAIYALNAQNKLTPKQVFASMQSYDLGCSYGGGVNTAAVFNDAGLAFISDSKTIKSQMRKGFGCESGFRRQRRAIDLQKELHEKESKFSDRVLQKCCRHGLVVIPMQLSCEERKSRIGQGKSRECVEAFLECCQFAVKLRDKKRQEEMWSGHGRTAATSTIEDFFDNHVQEIRTYFPPSFEFKVIEVNNKAVHRLIAPDSITTWEVQAVSLSSSHGFCVANPLDIRVFKQLFLALRLPYSVKRNEQLAIVVVIYNYGQNKEELAVNMKQVEGLCSPGAQSSAFYINITVGAGSSETVTFSAVPLKEGKIPIVIRLYDRDNEFGVDAIEKTLLVMTEGVEIRKEESCLINLDGKSVTTRTIDGMFPNMTVPDSAKNLFIRLEDEAFGVAAAMPLLSPSNVEKLIRAPFGCAEQTMIMMSPTALSIRYLDSSNHWLELPAGIRDTALDYLEKAYDRILSFKKDDGSYGAWKHYPTSHWLTALVVKVLSLVAECELSTKSQQQIVSQKEIRDSVKYLIKTQNKDGSFSDPHPVIHREMQGGIGGVEQDASLTAFITIALNHSLPYLETETDIVEEAISRATAFLFSRVDDLQRPFAVAITAYCLSTCLTDRKQAEPAWTKLQSLATQVGECKVWKANEDMRLVGEGRGYLVPATVALTVETTAYALLTALAWGNQSEAKAAACFLSSQENYEGGFKSTQDTIMALEALSEYGIHKTESTPPLVTVQFTTPAGRSEREELVLNTKGEKVEVELQRLLGGDITAKFSGKGEAKFKVVKAYYDFDHSSNCNNLSISVTVQGKVEYTAQVTENYDYDYQSDTPKEREEAELPQSSIEWFDVRSRRRRDTRQSSEDTLVYRVCVSHSQELSGMSIADITLLSGFEPNTDDLDKLKDLADTYISHYEVSQGRVLLYFNKIHNANDCIVFEAVQKVPVGLVQPAPASFYDYYEPDRRCSVFYSAPKRSKLVSVICSEDVCQCAERGCFTEKKTFESKIKKEERFKHACYQPVMDYGLVVTVKSQEEKGNFQMFYTTVDEVLRSRLSIYWTQIRGSSRSLNLTNARHQSTSYSAKGLKIF
ncbi:complement C4-B isoform X2 [Astyanax mexicanus]|uniref:complement C4-B isoform X2 n=1 Tax=Astyanax mexicanus TaxID=7994 RepID=UPI0020CADEEA|nr:complement C4-B isoform X2 [Astyanax mexicanus]